MFKIEEMKTSHLPQVLHISQTEFQTTSWHFDQFQTEIENANSVAYVATNDKAEVVGFLNLLVLPDEITILNIATKDEFKRKGIANMFMQQIKQLASHKQIKKIFLEVETTNHPAISFYQNHNFKVLRERKNYYSDGTSCFDMMLEL